MLRAGLDRIFNEYATARTEDLEGHPLAAFIRREFPAGVRSQLPNFPEFNWVGSPGRSHNWCAGPWLAAFHPVVTDSAQRGYYPVYLFTADLSSVYLSLNQGITDLKDELGAVEARNNLRQRASILRARLASDVPTFLRLEAIDLHAPANDKLLTFYEPGHAIGVRYDRDALPAESVLLEHLNAMLQLYRLAMMRGGTSQDDEEESDVTQGMPLEERRRYRYHRRIERNSRLIRAVKEAHGYVCQICQFDFERVYGELGRLYIEAHHRTPLSQLPLNTPVSLSPRDDFNVVCANCHRMLHRRREPPVTVEQLRSIITSSREEPGILRA